MKTKYVYKEEGRVLEVTIESGFKAKITAYVEGKRIRPVTSTINTLKGERFFQYQNKLWWIDRDEWKKVKQDV